MSFVQDLRYSLRRLIKSPGFTATALLTLALGMGATTAMYSVIHAVLLNSLPFSHPEQLLVRESQKTGEMSVAWPNFEDWRAQQHSVDGLAAFQLRHYDYFDGTQTTLTRGAQVTADFFPLLGAKPDMGRIFGPPDDKPGAAPVVVLGHKFWQNELHCISDLRIFPDWKTPRSNGPFAIRLSGHALCLAHLRRAAGMGYVAYRS